MTIPTPGWPGSWSAGVCRTWRAAPGRPRRCRAPGCAGPPRWSAPEEDDLHTLETALLTRKLREDVRVVVQLGNPRGGPGTDPDLGVRAGRGRAVRAVDRRGLPGPGGARDQAVGGALRRGPDDRAARGAACATVYGALAPVAVVPPGGDVAVCPGRDHEVSAGDVVTLIGTPAELRGAGVASLSEQPHHRLHHRGHGAGRRSAGAPRGGGWNPVSELRQFALSLLYAADRRLASALGLLSGAGHRHRHAADHVPLRGDRRDIGAECGVLHRRDVTTVGYGDFSFRGQSPVADGGGRSPDLAPCSSRCSSPCSPTCW